jgi:serine protease SohB
MQFLANYGLFLAKIVTALAAVLILTGGMLAILRKGKGGAKERLEIKKLNDKYAELADTLNAEILSKAAYKKLSRAEKKQQKKNAGLESAQTKKRIFVLNFHGDMRAQAVHGLREEITAILRVARAGDEVVVCLESGGGMVSPYGLAASQLQRLRQQKIPLTVIIDKVAASGGYLMACVADRILAAPFAIIGSIGVVAQIPNFHRFLKSKDVDVELLTAGQYKRTLTLFGENTAEGRQKMQQDLEDIHKLFQDFLTQYRPQLDLQQVATGEHWPAIRALELKLVDELITSDDYLLGASQQADVYQLAYTSKKSLGEKLAASFSKMTAGFSVFG